jgi:hypothetical protein
MKCNETQSKWCNNEHGASKIIDTFETYQGVEAMAKVASPQVGAARLGRAPWW